jgi:hypothetical protein
LFRCTTNEIACVKGTTRGKSCLACAKAKQKCEGATFPKVKKSAGSDAVAVGAEVIITALVDIVKVLRGVRSDLSGLTLAVKDRWGGKGDNEFEEGSLDNGEDGDEDCEADLSELREEMAQYREFVWERLGREIPGFDDEKTAEERRKNWGAPRSPQTMRLN